MVRNKYNYRVMFLVIAVTLIAGLMGAVACSEPEPPAAPAPQTAPSPTPVLKPVPQPAPQDNPREVITLPGDLKLPHTFWGHVVTASGKPAANVVVSVTVNGKQQEITITTDESGKYGGDLLVEFPSSLSVTGKNGDSIKFFADGQPAEETRLGTLVEVANEFQWEWQDLDPGWNASFVEGGHNAVDLVYTPAQ